MAQTYEELRAAQEAEYGTWVATQPITHDGVLAYNVGDPVPISNVEAYGYDEAELVEKVTPEKPKKPAAAAATDAAKG